MSTSEIKSQRPSCSQPPEKMAGDITFEMQERGGPPHFSYNAFMRERRLGLEDFLELSETDGATRSSCRATLNPFDDVVVLDRVKYAPNAGTVLRHLPLFGPCQALFLTNDGRQERQQQHPGRTNMAKWAGAADDDDNGAAYAYPRSFVKETLRMSMAFPHARAGSSSSSDHHDELQDSHQPHLCVGADLRRTLRFLKQQGFFLLAVENREVFEEMAGKGRRHLSRLRESHAGGDDDPRVWGEEDALPLHALPLAAGLEPLLDPNEKENGNVGDTADVLPHASVYEMEKVVLGNSDKRIAFVFGGELFGLSKETLRMCDAGVYIPTVDAVNCDVPPPPGVPPNFRPRAHTCNLSVAAAVVLSERHRQRMLRSRHSLPCSGPSSPPEMSMLSPSAAKAKIIGDDVHEETTQTTSCSSSPRTVTSPTTSSCTPERNPEDLDSFSSYRVLLFYLYTPLSDSVSDDEWATRLRNHDFECPHLHSRKAFAAHLQQFCDKHQISGRLRVAKDGLNGCLGGSKANLRLFTDAFSRACFDGKKYLDEDEHDEETGDAVVDRNRNRNRTFDDIHWKWGGLVEKYDVADGVEREDSDRVRATDQKMTGPTAVRLCDEVVSLFGNCYRGLNTTELQHHDVHDKTKRGAAAAQDSTDAWLRYYRKLFDSEACRAALYHRDPADTGPERSPLGDTTEWSDDTAPHHCLLPATHLSPEEWKRRLESSKPEDVVFFDARNCYETAIGGFECADAEFDDKKNKLPVRTRQFTDVPRILAENRQAIRRQCAGKQVFAYCTGGVRCERATQLLKIVLNNNCDEGEGAKAVYQLDGGIHSFLNRYPDGGGLYQGKNFVFDNRMVEDKFGDAVVGKCVLCQTPWDDYRLGARCADCRMRVLVCGGCWRRVGDEGSRSADLCGAGGTGLVRREDDDPDRKKNDEGLAARAKDGEGRNQTVLMFNEIKCALCKV